MNSPVLDQIAPFLNGQLDLSTKVPSTSRALLGIDSMMTYTYEQMTRPAFRRSRLDADSAGDLRRKLRMHISAGKPISCAIPFGGYKNYHVESYPEPDWAEVFNLNYLARYVLPIVAVYPPGVLIQYTYSSGVMDRVSNIPTDATTTYLSRFRALLSLFAEHLPSGLRIVDFDISQLYSLGELMRELQSNYDDNRARWTAKFSVDERSRRIASAKRNLVPDAGGVHYSDRAAPEFEERSLDAAMWCEAVDSLTLRRLFNKNSTNIQLVFVRGPSLSVHIGSCDTSAHHFWSGTGIVEVRRERLLPRIMSREKLETYETGGQVIRLPVETKFSAISSTFERVASVVLEQ